MIQIIVPLIIASILVGCGTKQISNLSTGTFIVHSQDGFPVSLFLDDKNDCFYQGYVKRYDSNSERFDIRINKKICTNGTTNDVNGYVYDENNMPGVKSLTIGTKVEVLLLQN